MCYKYLHFLTTKFSIVLNSKVNLKVSLCLSKHHAVKTYAGVKVTLHSFIIAALDVEKWSAAHSYALPPGREPQVCTAEEDVLFLPGCKIRSFSPWSSYYAVLTFKILIVTSNVSSNACVYNAKT